VLYATHELIWAFAKNQQRGADDLRLDTVSVYHLGLLFVLIVLTQAARGQTM